MMMKKTKIFEAILLSAFLTITCLTGTLAQTSTQKTENKIPPDMPVDSLQFNRTDITPSGYMESIQAMLSNVFFYRNFTLMMNCTQNCSLNMSLDPQIRNKLFSINIEPNQTMTLTMNVTSQPSQAEATMQQALNFYMKLETSPEVELQAQLRFHINQTELTEELGREVNASRLTWMYWNQTQTQWIPVESHIDQNGYLVCNTTHFSLWTVADIDPEQIPENIPFFTVIGIVALISVASIFLKRRKM